MREPWTVTCWFDPACPLSRITARWVELVAQHRPLRIDWRVMSLSILNEGLAVDPEGDPEGYLWIPARIAAAVRDRYDSDRLAAFAAALWTEQDGRPRDEMGDLGEALGRAALPADLYQLGLSTEADPVLRASHDAAVALVTGSVGTPIVEVVDPTDAQRAFFGPVITALPDGETSLRLWDGVLLVTGVPGFLELKT